MRKNYYICSNKTPYNMSKLIGRQEYKEELEDIYNSDRSEFVAVYGRRRIGKTFLIDLPRKLIEDCPKSLVAP